jgi:hypothetical protein
MEGASYSEGKGGSPAQISGNVVRRGTVVLACLCEVWVDLAKKFPFSLLVRQAKRIVLGKRYAVDRGL